jgi:nucleotidyltransferase substrate binding protein (TIGR01987 family)
MGRLNERITIANKALQTLESILTVQKTAEIQDATIHRFEYSFEAVWKAAAWHLREAHGMEAASLKSAIRLCVQVGTLSEESGKAAMTAANDRNLTVHTYNEELAEEIYGRIPSHTAALRSWVDGMSVEL